MAQRDRGPGARRTLPVRPLAQPQRRALRCERRQRRGWSRWRRAGAQSSHSVRAGLLGAARRSSARKTLLVLSGATSSNLPRSNEVAYVRRLSAPVLGPAKTCTRTPDTPRPFAATVPERRMNVRPWRPCGRMSLRPSVSFGREADDRLALRRGRRDLRLRAQDRRPAVLTRGGWIREDPVDRQRGAKQPVARRRRVVQAQPYTGGVIGGRGPVGVQDEAPDRRSARVEVDRPYRIVDGAVRCTPGPRIRDGIGVLEQSSYSRVGGRRR